MVFVDKKTLHTFLQRPNGMWQSVTRRQSLSVFAFYGIFIAYPLWDVKDLFYSIPHHCRIFTWTSLSCISLTSLGAPHMRSCALPFMGNGMTSRIFSSSRSSMTMRSIPGAIPAWGGAPNWNAWYSAPNFSRRSSSV